MWFLPSRRRLGQLQLLLHRMMATGISTPGRILVEANELAELIKEYDALQLPPDWDIVAVPAEGLAAKVQFAYEHRVFNDAKWIGLLTDDQVPITPHWDVKLVSQLTGANIVSSDDCDQAPKRMEGATVWSRALVDAVGYMAPSGLNHLYFDDVWERLGKQTGVLQWDMSVKVKHEPITYNEVRDSTADKVRSFHDEDERTYRKWVQTPDGYSAAIERIMAYLELTLGNVVRPDLKGMSLYLATPSMDGKLDHNYVRSYGQTIDKVRAAGALIDWGMMPYCADLSLARNRIFGSFLKSPHTHMLMVDADMGWNPDDVLRLMMTKLDFVGGAGPRKKRPLEFCCSMENDDGSFKDAVFDPRTQTLEVTHIGTGFLMITRVCAERIVQGYPDLIFDPGAGQIEYAVFDPLITPRRHRHADDYAFSIRWRALGGKIYVMPSIWLKHIGDHCFEGSLMDTLATNSVQEAAE